MEQYVFSFEAGNNKLFKEYWAGQKEDRDTVNNSDIF